MDEVKTGLLDTENTVCVSVPEYNLLIRKSDSFNRLSSYVQRQAEAATTGSYMALSADIVCFTLTGMTERELIREVQKNMQAEGSEGGE